MIGKMEAGSKILNVECKM